MDRHSGTTPTCYLSGLIVAMTNAPIVEVIAELRWGEGNPIHPAPFAFANESDYIKFGIEVGKFGYNQLERTMPQGIPGQPGGTVAYRYRLGEGDFNTLYQLGVGIFTTNGVAPYTSWATFRDVLHRGVEALNVVSPLASKAEVWCVVKYIDFFNESHLAGLTATEFFADVVGLQYQELDSAKDFSTDTSASSMRFFYSSKDSNGRELALDVGEGGLHDKPGIVMNTTIISSALKTESVEDVMTSFDDLQAVAHKTFFEMVNRSARVSANLGLGG